jgi:hypothetical protein
LQQDIGAVADEAARKYKEETRLEDLTINGGSTAAMLEAVKLKTQNLVSKLSKLTAVANPALGSKFLDEVLITKTQQLCTSSF